MKKNTEYHQTLRLLDKFSPHSFTHSIRVLLVVSLPELDWPWVGGNEDGTAQEGSQRGVEDGGEQRLEQQHG